MKKARRALLPLLILALALVLGVTALAADNVIASGGCGAQGDNVKWTLTDDGTLTISGTGEMDDYFIYSDHAPWYDYRDRITKAVIEKGVTNIGSFAFCFCKSLTSVTIPDRVTSFGTGAFAYCETLPSVTIPASVTSIGNYAFDYCYRLAAVQVENGNDNYVSVNGVLFNKAKTELIKYPAAKTGSYSVPVSVTKIGECAFFFADGLTSVTIPASVTLIADNAFFECSDNLVIHGVKGSAAEIYAEKYGITFKVDNTLKYSLPAPTGVKVSGEATGIKVTWTKVSGAAKYRVFYKPEGGSWTKAGDTTATSYTWTKAKSGTTYQIRVRCISSDGKTGTSDFSAAKSIKYIAAPKDVKVSSTSTGIKITWTKSAGAAKYRIYYKTGSGSWKTLVNTKSTSYTWTGAKDGVKYTFRVRCVTGDAKTVTSGYTADKTITYKK